MLRRFGTKLWRCRSSFFRLQHTSKRTSEPFIGLHVSRRVAAVRSSLNLPHETPSYDDLSRWRNVVETKDIVAISDEIEEAPTWVFLYLLSTKVLSPNKSESALKLMFKHLPKAELGIQPSLLILAARFLAKHQVVAPMTDVVQTFIMLDLRKPSSNFNLLLQAMSHFRPHPEVAKLIVRLLNAMHARQIRLHSRTYRALLSNKIVNLELTKLVQSKMSYEGVKPNASHLEAFLRVFGKQGAVRTAASYLRLIHELKVSDDAVAPHTVELTPKGALPILSPKTANTRWNTQFLRAFGGHAGSAFHYLQGLVGGNVTTSPSVVPNRSRLSTFSRRGRLPSLYQNSKPLSTWKTTFDIWDWTTALFSAAKDPRISSERLMTLLKQSKEDPRLSPTVATYTVVIRGLVKKQDYPAAMTIWKELSRNRMLKRKLDAKALTVAMDALVGNGKLGDAFVALVEAAQVEGVKYLSRVKVDTELINAFMSSLAKHGRPDAALLVWDSFIPLFGVHPDAQSLTILLRAAKSVSERDHSLKSVIARAGIHNPFRRHNEASGYSSSSRQEIIQDIQAKLKDEHHSTAPSIWNSEPAGLRCLQLFRSILLGNFKHLRDVQAPAEAVWSDDARTAHPVRDFVRSMGLRHQREDDKPLLVGPTLGITMSIAQAEVKDMGELSHALHPQVTPDEKTFAAYIALLGSQRRASEIPLALAWMRELRIVPHKRTLALALALWSEVSMRGPLIEQYGSVSEYQRLVRWLLFWLGKERLPTESQMIWARKSLQRERER